MGKTKTILWEELKKLFLIYREGDDGVSTHLFGQLEEVLTGFYKVRMGASSELEDMVQTALLKVHFARNRFDENLSLKTWVFTIAQRTLIDHWRVGAKDKENLVDLSLQDEEEGSSGLENLQDHRLALAEVIEIQGDFKKALEKLKPKDRSIVYLYVVEGLSMSEIAQIHEATEGAMKLRVHRALQQLKSLLLAFIIFLLLRDNL